MGEMGYGECSRSACSHVSTVQMGTPGTHTSVLMKEYDVAQPTGNGGGDKGW